MSKVKRVLCCLIGLMVVGVGFWLVGYHRLREEPRALLSVLPKNSHVSLNRIHHVATRDGVKEWMLDAESAQYQKTGNKTVFKDVSVTFFLQDGKTVHLTSRDGVLLTDTKNMEVWGDVVVRSGPYELSTDKLRYEYKTQSISTDTPIVIKGNRMNLTGGSMTFRLQTEEIVVWSKVKAVFEGLTL